MKNWIALFILILCLDAKIAYAETLEGCEHTSDSFKCVKYIRNYDGDTITVDIPGVHPLLGKKISVRVAEIDTPEVKGKGKCEKEAARTARRLVENLAKNAKRLNLLNVQRDKYFRILATVQVDGKDLKDLLLKNQLAYPYFGGTKEHRDWCRK